MINVVMARSASTAFRKLHGLFAVYKPPGYDWRSVRDTVKIKLLKELNSLKQRPPRQKIVFLPQAVEGSSGVELTKTATAVPVLADHILVKGPDYTYLKIGVVHKLDIESSGVLVFGIGQGNRILPTFYESHCSKDYTVCGVFGKASSDFSDAGKIIEKTTFDHITRDKFERVLAMIQGSNQKALLMHSHIDLKSQEAYDMAVQGQLRPEVMTPPLVLGMRCVAFSPPDFTIEIQCMHETQKYLRKLVHEIGLELRSSAVCTKVRRTREGPFTLDCALTNSHWNLDSISRAIEECRERASELWMDSTDRSLESGDNQESLGNGEIRTP
ncbi:pseudouridylate synthase TRUB2, mitochondrial isoform X2 [Pseudophryne corroboree]|uniref:pseudouridylate synthase TRUB2, mitochondrial isoform X2 n=1 Tax=Pseudophryne corroboree TaxID=495146 RepID=UPI003081BAA6